ncbi:MAG TPA: DoxX family protein [Burkholderiaceae bacterium]
MSASSLTHAPNSWQDLGKLILRLTLGLLLLLHGIAQLRTGVDGIAGMVGQAGLPSAVAYLVYVGEVIAPVLIVLGVFTRPAALVVMVNMVVAVSLVHVSQLATLSKSGGWSLELQGFYFFSAMALALLGAGRYSVGKADGRWN